MATEASGVIIGSLAAPERRRVVAAIILGATTVEEVKSATGLASRQVGRALARLVDAGLVIRDDDGRHWLVEEHFRQAAVALAPDDKAEVFDAPENSARVLRSFIRDGRLVSIPTANAKRRIVLDYLVQEFEPGRRYRERTVNTMLARWHEDVASLRRYLVEEGFLEREGGGGDYWRAGGTFDVP
jgi:hypothetical protein